MEVTMAMMRFSSKYLKFTPAQMQLFENDANNGNVDAQVKLGVIYSNGLYKRPDLKKSSQWLELAANAGNVIAQSQLAILYYRRNKEFQDYEKSFNWATAAANQGNRDAESILGVMYCKGQHVSKDYQKAVTFWKKASYKGCFNSMLDLGERYLKGQGVEQDKVRAYSWYYVADKFGNDIAKYAISSCCKSMQDSDFERAEAVIEKIVDKLKLEGPYWIVDMFGDYVTDH